METKVRISNEVFVDDAGNSMPYVAYVMELEQEEFRLVPKKKDKRLISYLIAKHNALPEVDSHYDVTCKITQEQFRDPVKRKTIDYVAYTIELYGRSFRFGVREEDKALIKFLLEEKGFFIDDIAGADEDDD